jgi:predicted nucleic acid-binding Zn ribbon protein
MLYDFKCSKCGKEEVHRISADEVNTNPDWNKVECTDCSVIMYRVILSAAFIFKGEQPLGRQQKQKREAEEAIQISKQPFDSTGEVQTSMGMAAEEEKKRGMTPGTLTSGVKMPETKEKMDSLKKRSADKIKASRAKRGK